jgi:hypothetical protein
VRRGQVYKGEGTNSSVLYLQLKRSVLGKSGNISCLSRTVHLCNGVRPYGGRADIAEHKSDEKVRTATSTLDSDFLLERTTETHLLALTGGKPQWDCEWDTQILMTGIKTQWVRSCARIRLMASSILSPIEFRLVIEASIHNHTRIPSTLSFRVCYIRRDHFTCRASPQTSFRS